MNPEEAFAWGETTAEAIGRGPASAITGDRFPNELA
jgi:hypothetical protein